MGLYSDVIFPKIYDLVIKHKVFDEKRAQLLRQASGNILEIGIGTGINLNFYPRSVKEITAIDINRGMEKELEHKHNSSPVKVNFVLGSVEKIPFPDRSFDTVVSTLTLCSLPHLQQALSEIRRVLRPEGHFLFLDHGLSPEPSVAKWQRRLNPLQSVIACGCHLTVPVESELLKAGFQFDGIHKYYLEKAPKFLGYLYEGSARPASLEESQQAHRLTST